MKGDEVVISLMKLNTDPISVITRSRLLVDCVPEQLLLLVIFVIRRKPNIYKPQLRCGSNFVA